MQLLAIQISTARLKGVHVREFRTPTGRPVRISATPHAPTRAHTQTQKDRGADTATDKHRPTPPHPTLPHPTLP